MASSIDPIKNLWTSLNLNGQPFIINEVIPEDARDGIEWELYTNDDADSPALIILEPSENDTYNAQALVGFMTRLPTLMANLFNAFDVMESKYRRNRRALFIAQLLLDTSKTSGLASTAWRHLIENV